MDMIDRYVQAVTERLPQETKEDVARELRANIEDMLPGEPTEADARAVLEKLGNPAILANEYRQTKRYLIGPAMYDSYFSVLKLVVGIAAIAFTFLALLGVISKPVGHEPVGYMTGMITNILAAAFEGAVQAFLWVTLVFAVMERTGVPEGSLPFRKKKWSVDDLPPAAERPGSKISRTGTVTAIIFSVIFISIFLFRPELFAWYKPGDNGPWLAVPVFDLVRLHSYLPAMVILAAVQFGLEVYKFITRRWTLPLAAVNTLYNLGISILACLMLNDRNLLNRDLLVQIAGVFRTTVGRLEYMLDKGLPGFLIGFVAICGINSISGFVMCRRKLQLPRIPPGKK